jgi:site-specific DNA-methyltransferase (adenine-specific)
VTRVEHIGDATLYLGDCREVLSCWPNKLHDVIVSDPPYGIEKAGWDDHYPEWFEREALRVARAVCIMPGLWALPKCVSNMGDAYKSVIAGRNANGMTFGPIGFNNWIPAVYGGEVLRKGQDAFDFSVGAEPKPNHPSPKPLSYMIKLLDRVSEQHFTVCDPFMGSGTTGVACAMLGRTFVGVELDPGYFDIACRRIEEAQRQGDLLRDVLPKAEQKVLGL